MPDWCWTNICIYGPKKERDRFHAELEAHKRPEDRGHDTEYSMLETWVPMPKALLDTPSHYPLLVCTFMPIIEKSKLPDDFIGIVLNAYTEQFNKLPAITSISDALRVAQSVFRPDFIQAKAAVKLKRKYGYASWYEWAMAHWDSKWPDECELEQIEDDCLVYKITTPYNEPMPALKTISKLFPKLHFSCSATYETGGYSDIDIRNGKILKREDFDDDENEEEE